MRRTISLLVAATTSAVIIAFLIPLAMLVRTLAEDRAIAGASQEAQGVATLVAGVQDESQLKTLVDDLNQVSTRATSVVMPDWRLIGTARLSRRPRTQTSSSAHVRVARSSRWGTRAPRWWCSSAPAIEVSLSVSYTHS